MSQSHRLAAGGRIDRGTPLQFTFNGKRYEGHGGDTLASALLANGITLVARSWKYHRPRGIVGSGVEEPNAIVQLETGARTVPNARATEIALYDGLIASSVNAWPSVEFDLMAVSGLFARFMPAGFYYKTFMWPKSFWMNYEHFIRKASGLGTAPSEPDPDVYDKMNAHCDVLVAGGGPAGLAAAWAAGRAGARVILADEQSEFGGSLLRGRDEASAGGAASPLRGSNAGAAGEKPSSGASIDGVAPLAWVARIVAELKTMPDVRLLPRSTVFGYHDQNFLTAAERRADHLPPDQREGPRERVWRVRAKQVVLATGAIERPLVFANNDRPGVMLASAVSTYLNRYGVKTGSRAVVFANNDSAYETALDLAAAGLAVAAVVDARRAPRGARVERVRAAGIEVIANAVVVDVEGRKRVSAVEVMALDGEGSGVTGPATFIPCDLLAMSGGWSPVVHLHAQSGGKARFDESEACFVPGASVQDERSAGACNGSFALRDCLAEGFAAGAEAARLAGMGDDIAPVTPAVDDVVEEPLMPVWLVPSAKPIGRGPKQFVDLQNDVASSDIALAAREGYQSIEHVKRYTALGFGTDQGKLGNINGMAILAQALGNDIASTGTTTFRPNYTPVTFGAIAGRDLGERFEPVRKTALHQWHEEHGALFENVGQWKRPWYFPKAGESLHDAVKRECLATRNGVGIMDASTLGKIDIQGPDAATFLDWVYTNAWQKLGVGRCRYGLMLDENGMVMDDGVTTRIAEHHYLMTTTTGGAARVMAWLERWLQTEWPHLQVYLTSVTDHWATAAVAGPASREVVQSISEGIDFSPAAFPFMSCREGTVADVPARVMRISFSGELAFEINVCANEARHVWEALMAAGAAHGITPYGTETMHVLRAEKGFIIVGQDTDGSVTPVDLGMEWIVAKGKDFIGRRSLSRSDMVRGDRKQLVGLLTDDPMEVLPEGGQIVADASVPVPVPMHGHVTSSYFSASLNRSIALALVKGGRNRKGEKVEIPLASGRMIRAVIADSVFIDPEGARQNV
jgi:sarcosine oxidase subunit alpha